MRTVRLSLLFIALLVPFSVCAQRDPPVSEVELKSALLGRPFGLKYPEMFGMVASMSGAFSAASWKEKDLQAPGLIRDSVLNTFGPADSPTRAANDVLKLAREMSVERIKSLPYIYFDCGTEDFLFKDNRDLAGLLVERKIPHEYRQLPGSHNWQYWDTQIREILRLTAERLGPPK